MNPVLRIDLDAFAANLRHIRGIVAPAEHLLVVKDDAYGHGVEQIVSRAWAEGVRWFGAFDVPTAQRVRATVGEEARIFVWLAATGDDLETAASLDLDVGVGDAAVLDAAARVAAGTGRRLRIHLKIDTGLHRNGIRPEDWDDALARAHAHRGTVEVVGVWSHLAEASDADDDAAAAQFADAVARARAAGFDIRHVHLAASAASFLRPEFRNDLVRVGAFAYGIRPAGGPGESELGIRRVATLAAPVVAVDRDEVRIAIGSLHGLPSVLGGRTDVGTPTGLAALLEIAPLESRVARWREALVGDEVIVYGAGGPSATDLAEAIDTIGEEIAVRVSPLVRREWF